MAPLNCKYNGIISYFYVNPIIAEYLLKSWDGEF